MEAEENSSKPLDEAHFGLNPIQNTMGDPAPPKGCVSGQQSDEHTKCEKISSASSKPNELPHREHFLAQEGNQPNFPSVTNQSLFARSRADFERAGLEYMGYGYPGQPALSHYTWYTGTLPAWYYDPQSIEYQSFWYATNSHAAALGYVMNQPTGPPPHALWATGASFTPCLPVKKTRVHQPGSFSGERKRALSNPDKQTPEKQDLPLDGRFTRSLAKKPPRGSSNKANQHLDNISPKQTSKEANRPEPSHKFTQRKNNNKQNRNRAKTDIRYDNQVNGSFQLSHKQMPRDGSFEKATSNTVVPAIPLRLFDKSATPEDKQIKESTESMRSGKSSVGIAIKPEAPFQGKGPLAQAQSDNNQKLGEKSLNEGLIEACDPIRSVRESSGEEKETKKVSSSETETDGQTHAARMSADFSEQNFLVPGGKDPEPSGKNDDLTRKNEDSESEHQMSLRSQNQRCPPNLEIGGVVFKVNEQDIKPGRLENTHGIKPPRVDQRRWSN